jgi:HemY protein
MLRRALDSNWSDNLAELYGRLETESGAQRLAIAESWLKQYPGNPMLLLMLGRLSLKERLWGKARSYLEASIGFAPTPQAYQELGALLEKMDESEQAMECFRTGLDLSSRWLSGCTGSDLDPADPSVDSALQGGSPDLDRSRLALVHEDNRGR